MIVQLLMGQERVNVVMVTHTQDAEQQQNGCQWSDLFTLPQREGMMGEASCYEKVYVFLLLFSFAHHSFLYGFHLLSLSDWQPDPDAPFDSSLVPESLREQVNKFETTEVPSMGLMPRLLPASAPSTTTQQTSSSPAVQLDKQQPPPSELSHPSPPLPPPAVASRDYLVS